MGIDEGNWNVENSLWPPIYSEVELKHSLALRSARKRFLVEQATDPLTPEQIEGPAVAQEYMHSLSYSK